MMTIGKSLAAIALVVGLAWYAQRDRAPPDTVAAAPAGGAATGRGEPGLAVAPPAVQEYADAAQAAFDRRVNGQMLRVSGRVRRTLADDRDGSPHQRFIIATSRDLTLLVAHNLDLAPRLEGLGVGDQVEVYGEYEWNPQGGVMHWTHDDPQGTHPAGYIDWKGRRYQ